MSNNYGIVPLAPGGSVRTSWDDLNNGDNDWQRTLSVTGVATQHEIYVSESGDAAIYVVRPDGGYFEGAKRWKMAEHEFPAWNLIDDDVDAKDRFGVTRFVQQAAAELYAVKQAHLEVADEMGWEL